MALARECERMDAGWPANDDVRRLLDLVQANWITQAIDSAMAIGAFENLEAAPTVKELSGRLGCRSASRKHRLRATSRQPAFWREPSRSATSNWV
jgi:hypothetical protein